MYPKRLSLIFSASLISGLVGVVYGLTLQNGMEMAPAFTAVVYFVLGATLGVGCGFVATAVSELTMRALGKRPLALTLVTGVVVGLLAGLLTGQDLVLCAMLGEVGALVLGQDSSGEAVY